MAVTGGESPDRRRARRRRWLVGIVTGVAALFVALLAAAISIASLDFFGPYPDTDIHVFNADGSEQASVTKGGGADQDPAWSPDGRAIAFVRTMRNSRGSDKEIFAADIEGGSLENLSRDPDHSDEDPAWSPDGTTIAYVRTRAGFDTGEIYFMNADGSAQHSLRWGSTLAGGAPGLVTGRHEDRF